MTINPWSIFHALPWNDFSQEDIQEDVRFDLGFA